MWPVPEGADGQGDASTTGRARADRGNGCSGRATRSSPLITGVILAGGRASRFGGQPKGLQFVGGTRIIDRVAASLRAATDRLLIISNDPAAPNWLPGAKVASDVLGGAASLVGIHSALVRAASDVIVIAWDMPFVPPGLVETLRDRLIQGRSAVVPCSTNGPEGLCAAYSSEALSHIERLARAGSFKLSGVLDSLPDVDRMNPIDVARFGVPEVMFFNVNSPDDLARAEEIANAL